MENRAIARRCVGACRAILLLALAGCIPSAPHRELAAGDDAPAALSTGPGVQVVWIVGDADLLACRNRARELRALKARHGSRMRLVLVVVGGGPELAKGFLRVERLDAELTEIGRGKFREEFGAAAFPALLIVEDGRIRAAWRDLAKDDAPPPTAPGDLSAVLGTLLPGSERDAGTHHEARGV